MKKKGMDGKFLDFPLCCLTYINCERERLEEIAFFCVVEHANEFKDDYAAKERMRTTDYLFIKADDFMPDNEFHIEIALASEDLGIPLDKIEKAMGIWNDIKLFVQQYEYNYGTDAYCRVGRQLFFEVLEGEFSFPHFLVLCAIQSILGKEAELKSITYKTISIRMQGYKKKAIAFKEKPNICFPSDHKVGKCVLFLKEKKLINTFLYNNRQKYYSTQLKGKSLGKAVAKLKIKKAEMKNSFDRELSNEIKNKIKQIKGGNPSSNHLETEET